MLIIKHKDIELTPGTVRDVLEGKQLPDGCGLAVDRGDGFICFGPLDTVNLFGEYGPGTDYIELSPEDY